MTTTPETIKAAAAFFQGTPESAIVQDITEHPDLGSPDTLESIKDLAYWAYIRNNSELSLQIGDLISGIPFEGNFDIWTWVQFVLVLQSRIYKEQGAAAKAQQCIDTINELFSYGDESKIRIRKKAFARRLGGSLLQDDKIKEAAAAGNEEAELQRRFLQVNELCFIKELGGSETFPPEAAEAQIQEQLTLIRKGRNI